MERTLATKLFKQFPNIKDYYFTKGKICYDGIINCKDGKSIIFEIKVRDFAVDKYPDYILQVDKLRNLEKAGAANGCTHIYYINFFKDENDKYSFIVFNLSSRIEHWKKNGSPPIVLKKMNDATFKSTSYKIDKEVVMIKKEDTDMFGHIKIK